MLVASCRKTGRYFYARERSYAAGAAILFENSERFSVEHVEKLHLCADAGG